MRSWQPSASPPDQRPEGGACLTRDTVGAMTNVTIRDLRITVARSSIAWPPVST